MKLNLKNKVAIITGGSKGIGREISIALAAEGVRVIIAARNTVDIDEVCSCIRKSGGEAFGIQVDVTSELEATEAVRRTIENFGQLDFLINNAGGAVKFGSLQDCSEKDWLDSFRLNVIGCVNFVKASEAALIQSSQGRILTISSISGLQPGLFNPHYCASKAATINFSKYLANIYASKNICCNVLCVGPVHSDSWNSNVESIAVSGGISFQEAYNQLEEQESLKIPLGRVGEPMDVSGMVVFLMSERASWITGATFQINGGKYAAIS